MRKFLIKISKDRFKIHNLIQEVGQDILVSIWGGTRPHIGAIGMAIPRPSLKNPQKWSATSSIQNLTQKLSDQILKKILSPHR